MRKQQDQYPVASQIITSQFVTRQDSIGNDCKHRNRQEKHRHAEQENHRAVAVLPHSAHQHDKDVKEHQLHHDHQANVDLRRQQGAANYKSSDLKAYLHREYTEHHAVCADGAFAWKKRVDIGQEKTERQGRRNIVRGEHLSETEAGKRHQKDIVKALHCRGHKEQKAANRQIQRRFIRTAEQKNT